MENIHPNLRKEAFFANYGLMIFVVSTIVPLVIVFIILQATLQFDFIRTVSLFLGLLLISVVSTLVYLKVMKYFRLRVTSASKALYQKPVKGIIQPDVLQSIWGIIFKVKDEEGHNNFIALKVQKYGIKKMHNQPVELYKSEKSGDVAVVKNNDKFLIGKLHSKNAESVTHAYRKAGNILFITAAVVIAVLIIAQSFHYFVLKSEAEFAAKTKQWPTVNGTVISSEIIEVRIKQGKSHVKGYKADVEYSYILNGKEFRNKLIHLAYEPGTNSDYAQYYFNKYPAGSSQMVYYNPNDYSFALLEPGHEEDILKEIEKEVYVVTGAVSGLLILTTIILFVVFKDQEKKAVKFFS